MKKLSEMKFIKPNIKKVEAKMNEIIHDFENAKSFNEQDAILKKFNKYIMVNNMNWKDFLLILNR